MTFLQQTSAAGNRNTGTQGDVGNLPGTCIYAVREYGAFRFAIFANTYHIIMK